MRTLDIDADFDGSYGAPANVLAMAARVFKIVMIPGNMVKCNMYRDVPAYTTRLFKRLVDDDAFVAMTRTSAHPLFQWLWRAIDAIKQASPTRVARPCRGVEVAQSRRASTAP
jgi:hypothetical protein